VWLDINGNGVQDPGESGIDGVTVELQDSISGATLASTTTSGDGMYLFDDLLDGNYTITVQPQPSLVATYDLDGELDNSTVFMLGFGQNRTDIDFGYQVPAMPGTGSSCPVLHHC